MTAKSMTQKTMTKMTTKDIVFTGVFAALMAVCSWISIPTVVPFTLQTFAVFLAVGLLGGKRGTLAVTVYILLGAVGLPVFSGFEGGIGCILGVTGGYILGFVVSALIMWLFEYTLGRKPVVLILSMITGLIACYAVGTFWFMTVYSKADGPISFVTTLSFCVIPFIIPDIIKIALAYVLTRRLYPFIANL